MERIDCVCIGGGPSGMMAALSVKKHHPKYSVAIIEKTAELGKKLVVSGAGRGNVTNSHLARDPAHYYHGNKSFISTVILQFGYEQITSFFKELGIPLHEEKKTDRGKIFPVIENARTIRDILALTVIESEIACLTGTVVYRVKTVPTGFLIETSAGEYCAGRVVLSCGGRTYPALGSDGSGYVIANDLGHSIVQAVPCAVPLVSKNPLSQYLQGEKIVMTATTIIDGNAGYSSTDEVLFTQYGFSGPAIFDISRDLSVCLNRNHNKKAGIRLNFLPGSNAHVVYRIIEDASKRYPKRFVYQALWGLFSVKVSGAVCGVSGIPKDRLLRDLSVSEINALVATLSSFETIISSTRGWNEAEFTAGGVDTSEINSQTLESRKVKGLYFTGEIIDVDGIVGGYNLSWAWASGYLAGTLNS